KPRASGIGALPDGLLVKVISEAKRHDHTDHVALLSTYLASRTMDLEATPNDRGVHRPASERTRGAGPLQRPVGQRTVAAGSLVVAEGRRDRSLGSLARFQQLAGKMPGCGSNSRRTRRLASMPSPWTWSRTATVRGSSSPRADGLCIRSGQIRPSQ